MFFLLRAAFWIGLVLLLLPTDRPDGRQTGDRRTTASQAIEAAGSTLRDLEGFCDRHAVACDGGRATLEDFGTRAVESIARARAQSALAVPSTTSTTPAAVAPAAESRAEKVDAKTDLARASRPSAVRMPQPRPLS